MDGEEGGMGTGRKEDGWGGGMDGEEEEECGREKGDVSENSKKKM